jgi:hypothetical protein
MPQTGSRLLDAFLPRLTKFARPFMIPEQADGLGGTFLDGIKEDTAHSVGHLERNPAGAACDNRRAFPERFGRHQAESLAKRFLNDHVRKPLKCADVNTWIPASPWAASVMLS